MKRILLTVACAAITLVAGAQITVQRSDYAVAGDWYLMADDTLINASSSAMLKSTGANVNWDITGWAHRHVVDTLYYADGLTYPSAPAGCNLASYNKDRISGDALNETFYMVNGSDLRMIIDAGTMTGNGAALRIFKFPSTMGANFKDSSTSFITMLASDIGLNLPLIDSLKIIYKLVNNSLVDGYGKLKMDAGTFDVLKQKSIMDVLVSFQVRNLITGTYTDLPSGTGFGSVNQRVITYTWVSSNGGHPLLQATEDTSGAVTDMTYMLASVRGIRSGLRESSRVQQLAKVYPVPAHDQLTIETQASSAYAATLQVYDILGNEVVPARQVEVTGGLNQYQMSVNGLKPGVYFFTLTGNGNSYSSKFVVK